MTHDVAFSAIIAPLDARLSSNDRKVMATIAAWHNAGEITLDTLCQRIDLPRPHVFYSVARLEDLGYLPKGAIRHER